MEEKQELKFDNLRELCLKLNELILRPGIKLAAPVFMTIYPDGQTYIE